MRSLAMANSRRWRVRRRRRDCRAVVLDCCWVVVASMKPPSLLWVSEAKPEAAVIVFFYRDIAARQTTGYFDRSQGSCADRLGRRRRCGPPRGSSERGLAGDVDVDDLVGNGGNEVVLGPRDTGVGARE